MYIYIYIYKYLAIYQRSVFKFFYLLKVHSRTYRSPNSFQISRQSSAIFIFRLRLSFKVMQIVFLYYFSVALSIQTKCGKLMRIGFVWLF